jgi:hypothetical protein
VGFISTPPIRLNGMEAEEGLKQEYHIRTLKLMACLHLIVTGFAYSRTPYTLMSTDSLTFINRNSTVPSNCYTRQVPCSLPTSMFLQLLPYKRKPSIKLSSQLFPLFIMAFFFFPSLKTNRVRWMSGWDGLIFHFSALLHTFTTEFIHRSQ